MLGFHSLTSGAKSNIPGNVTLHTIPPISDLKIMVHLIPSWIMLPPPHEESDVARKGD
jgi:hypothetical protein